MKDRLLDYIKRLRFPKLLALTLVLFAVDVVVPDIVPFVDEIMLALVAAMLSAFKKGRRNLPEVPAAP